MTRGRRADPAGVKAIKGNTRRQKSVPKAAAPVEATPLAAMPGYMTLRKAKLAAIGQRVRAKTDVIIGFLQPRLREINFLKDTDVNGFYRYCRYMAEWLVCCEVLDEEGEHYLAKSDHNPDGIWRRHPAGRKVREVEQAMRLIEAEYGMTPARRQQMMLQMAASNIAVSARATDMPLEPSQEGQLFDRGPIGFGQGRGLPH